MNLKIKSYLYVYIGTIFYTLAAYYHLSLKDWSFLKALKIAMPLVFIEYTFSLRANRSLNKTFNNNSVQILLITMCFYFINVLNLFIKPMTVFIAIFKTKIEHIFSIIFLIIFLFLYSLFY
jgi:hypothetical protein